jgi:hypothetical protein
MSNSKKSRYMGLEAAQTSQTNEKSVLQIEGRTVFK